MKIVRPGRKEAIGLICGIPAPRALLLISAITDLQGGESIHNIYPGSQPTIFYWLVCKGLSSSKRNHHFLHGGWLQGSNLMSYHFAHFLRRPFASPPRNVNAGHPGTEFNKFDGGNLCKGHVVLVCTGRRLMDSFANMFAKSPPGSHFHV